MKATLAVVLIVALAGVTLVATAPTASACIPYSVCWASGAARCTLQSGDVEEALDRCWAPLV